MKNKKKNIFSSTVVRFFVGIALLCLISLAVFLHWLYQLDLSTPNYKEEFEKFQLVEAQIDKELDQFGDLIEERNLHVDGVVHIRKAGVKLKDRGWLYFEYSSDGDTLISIKSIDRFETVAKCWEEDGQPSSGFPFVPSEKNSYGRELGVNIETLSDAIQQYDLLVTKLTELEQKNGKPVWTFPAPGNRTCSI